MNVEPPSTCAFASVGGGWAGIYAAWRVAIDTKTVSAADTCIFEASSRFGGRTYSVFGDSSGDEALGGLNIDIGAYRFAHVQRLPSDLITGPLNLTSGCYLPSCSPEPLDDNLTLYKLLKPDRSTAAGYGTALHTMLDQLQKAGATYRALTRLIGMYPAATDRRAEVELRWADGARTVVSHAFLNLPRHALLALAPDSLLWIASPPRSRALFNCSRELYERNYSAEASVKVYAVYEDAWWGTRLNLWEGEVREAADPPVYIRYHDGPIGAGCGRGHASRPPVEESSSGGSTSGDRREGRRCKGALLVQYAHSNEEGAGYYLPFQQHAREPLQILNRSHPLAAKLHAKLLSMHAAELHAAGIEPASLSPPTALVMGFWLHASEETLHPAPEPLSFSTAPGKLLPECVRGLTSAEYSVATRRPLPGWPVMVANNDWWLEESRVDRIAPYWAEVSLRSAERALNEGLALPRPAWLSAQYYENSVLEI